MRQTFGSVIIHGLPTLYALGSEQSNHLFVMHGFPIVTNCRLPHVNISFLEPINPGILELFLYLFLVRVCC